MIKLIVGNKGSGKTKRLIGMVNEAVTTSKGNVVCVEKGNTLTFDISHQARLIDIDDYAVSGFDAFYGFFCGLFAGNYDITHVFIDSLTKIVPSEATSLEVENFLDWLNNFGEDNNIKFTVTISADESLASDGVKKYF